MTEKIKRRGVHPPEHYVPDILEIKRAADAAVAVKDLDFPLFPTSIKANDLKEWLRGEGMHYPYNTIFISGSDRTSVSGTIDKRSLFGANVDPDALVGTMMSRKVYSIYHDNALQLVVEFMLKTGQDILPVVDRSSRLLTGFISQYDVLKTFEQRFHEDRHQSRHISVASTTRRAISKGKKLFDRNH